jgi:hypothetical protein
MTVHDINQVRTLEARVAMLESDRLHNGGGPPYDGSMDARVSKLEAVIPTLATREDLAALRLDVVAGDASIRAEMHKGFSDLRAELHTQTWRLIGVLALVVMATIAIGKWLQL